MSLYLNQEKCTTNYKSKYNSTRIEWNYSNPVKMKTTLALVFASCFLAVAFAEKCFEQAQCVDVNTCCAGVPPFGGVCSPLTPEGAKCSVVDKTVPMFGDFFIPRCPCEEGLVCVQQGEKKNDGVCQLPPTTPAPATETIVDEAGDAEAEAAPAEAAPAEAAPAEAAPAEAAPAEAAPAEAAPAEAAPAEAAPAEAAPAEAAPAEAAPAEAAPAEE